VLWIIKRKAYSGPKFDVIMGEVLPVAEATVVEEQESTKSNDASSLSKSKDDGSPSRFE
jgi:hypothetical protein